MDTPATTTSYINDLLRSLKNDVEDINRFRENTDPDAPKEDCEYLTDFAREYLKSLSFSKLTEVRKKEYPFFMQHLRKSIVRAIAAHLFETDCLLVFAPSRYEAYMMNYTLTELVRIVSGENKRDMDKIKLDLYGKFGRNSVVSLKYIKKTKYPS